MNDIKMKTLKKVEVKAKFVVIIPPLPKMEENIIYISLPRKVGSHLCLCGCGHEVVTSFAENGWVYSMRHSDWTLTITPSIASNSLPCKSHYIITNNIANFV